MPLKRLIQPCKPNCPDRSGICHSICQKWKEYEKQRNENYEIIFERKEAAKRTYPAATDLDKRYRK